MPRSRSARLACFLCQLPMPVSCCAHLGKHATRTPKNCTLSTVRYDDSACHARSDSAICCYRFANFLYKVILRPVFAPLLTAIATEHRPLSPRQPVPPVRRPRSGRSREPDASPSQHRERTQPTSRVQYPAPVHSRSSRMQGMFRICLICYPGCMLRNRLSLGRQARVIVVRTSHIRQ